MSLIHHATAHIKYLETTLMSLEIKLQRLESEMEQLQALVLFIR